MEQFYDGGLRIARTLAPTMGLPSVAELARHQGVSVEDYARHLSPGYAQGPAAAYDTLFFYAEDATWDELDRPRDWLTQLVPAIHVGLDPERSFWEFDFYAELERRGRAYLER